MSRGLKDGSREGLRPDWIIQERIHEGCRDGFKETR